VSLRPPRLSVAPEGADRLARRAEAMARGEAGLAPSAGGGPEAAQALVTFTLAGHLLALEAGAVVRAVARLGRTAAVARAGAAPRRVAWVEEQPVVVADLAALAGLPARSTGDLERSPALVIDAPAGPGALAVEGPLALAEDRLEVRAGAALTGAAGLGQRGRLASGAALLDAAWLAVRAAEDA
jgi:hypothetical protein